MTGVRGVWGIEVSDEFCGFNGMQELTACDEGAGEAEACPSASCVLAAGLASAEAGVRALA